MPDELLPPSWGSALFDERDLDAVLAGETADVPDALRPVADALAQLRAAPAPSELRGEANAMAQFRELVQGQAARRAEPAATLLLPARGAGQRRQATRHRGRRRAPGPGRRRHGALLATGAAAAIVAAAVFTGSLPNPIAHLARTPTNSPSASHSGQSSSPPNVEITSAAKEPTGSPSATRSAASAQRAAVCRAYYGYYKHPVAPDWRAEASLGKQLSKMAGSTDLDKVYKYCAPYLTQSPPTHSGTGNQGSGDQGGPAGGAGGNQNSDSGSNQNGGSGAQQNG
jgi:hypothetical protein